MKHFFLSIILIAIAGFSFGQHNIAIELKTDNYGSETSWELINTITGATIGEGGPYTNVSGGTLYNFDFDVTGDECYSFYIYDSYGDGMCCNYGTGYFKVYYDSELVDEGGSFTTSDAVMAMGTGCPQHEIELDALTMSEYALFSVNYNITGRVVNNGLANLTNFQVSYKIGNGEFVAPYTVTCNVAMGGTATFTHNVPAVFSTEGPVEITVFVSNPNGNTDNEDNNTLTHNLYVNPASVPHNALLEHFTTAQCPNCPAATTNLTNWTNTRPNIIWISHHAGYYTDAYTVTENTTLLAFYNDGGSTYAPAIMLDRMHLAPEGDPGPVFFPGSSFTPGLMDQRRNAPAFVTVEMEGDYNPDTRVLNLTVSGEFVGTVNGSPRISVYVVEDGLVGTQQGATGNYTHNHVMRDAISDVWGDAGSISNGNTGTTFTKNYTYTMNASWTLANLSVVAFVNDYNSSINDREVYNASKMHLSDFVSVDPANIAGLKIFPNPATDVLNIANAENADVQIFNITGQMIHRISNASALESISTENMPQGTYIIKITKDNLTRTEKVVITK